MATRKTTTTKTVKTGPQFRSPRRPASRPVAAKAAVVKSPASTVVDAVSQAATNSIRLGVGTAILLSENTTKFFNDAMERGKTVDFKLPEVSFPSLDIPQLPKLALPTFDFPSLDRLRTIPSDRLAIVKDGLTKLWEETSNFVNETTKQVRHFSFLPTKKTDANIEEEVLNVVAKLDLPSKTDVKQLSQRITELSKRIEKVSKPGRAASAA